MASRIVEPLCNGLFKVVIVGLLQYKLPSKVKLKRKSHLNSRNHLRLGYTSPRKVIEILDHIIRRLRCHVDGSRKLLKLLKLLKLARQYSCEAVVRN